MTINLPSDMEQLVKNLVVTGTYASEQDAVNEGLRLLMSREQLKAEIAKGIRDLDEGRCYDEETAFAEIEKELREYE